MNFQGWKILKDKKNCPFVIWSLLSFLCFFNLVFAQSETNMKKVSREMVALRFFKAPMGNLHQNPSRYSQVVTTINCNYPVKLLKEIDQEGKEKLIFGDGDWSLVKVGPYEAYVMTEYLQEKKAKCFDEEYSKFYDSLKLTVSDSYYWARLYDHYIFGKSKVMP